MTRKSDKLELSSSRSARNQRNQSSNDREIQKSVESLFALHAMSSLDLFNDVYEISFLRFGSGEGFTYNSGFTHFSVFLIVSPLLTHMSSSKSVSVLRFLS